MRAASAASSRRDCSRAAADVVGRQPKARRNRGRGRARDRVPSVLHRLSPKRIAALGVREHEPDLDRLG
jgi:hypothetical protein